MKPNKQILASHVWRQDHNGFTHQDPGFIDHVVNKQAEVVRVYFRLGGTDGDWWNAATYADLKGIVCGLGPRIVAGLKVVYRTRGVCR